MRSDFIPFDAQDANERRRQPAPAFNAAPLSPSESFALMLAEPQERAHYKAKFGSQAAGLAAESAVTQGKAISSFTGAPAVIPSAVVPPVDLLSPSSESAAVASGQATELPSPISAPPVLAAAPALAALSGRREPVPAFAATKTDMASTETAAPIEWVKGNAAYAARPVTAEEAVALADDGASLIPKGAGFFGEDGMTTADFFSIINPLQHLPLIGALYRDLTGDTLKPGSRILGGMLFGGPLGMVSGAFNAGIEQELGTDSGGAMLALLRGKPLGEAAKPLLTAAQASTADVAQSSGQSLTPAATPASVQMAQMVPAPLPVSAPRVLSPPRLMAQPAQAGSATSESSSIVAETPKAPPAPALTSVASPANAAPEAKATGFALSPGGKEFPIPARTNNVQPRQPFPTARADLSRARELAPLAPLSARADAPRPDRSLAPAQLIAPGLSQTDMTPGMPMSGVSNTRMPPVSSAPLGVPGLPQSALPDAMSKALDKYDALLKSRKGNLLNQQS